MEGRVKPEPPLRRKIGFHNDIGDEEAILKNLALTLQAQGSADRAVGAIRHQQVVAVHAIVAVTGMHGNLSASIIGCHVGDLVQPAQLDLWHLHGAVHHILFHIVLLQVDEGGHFVIGLLQQVEVVDLFLTEVHLAQVPGNALVQHGLSTAVAITDLQGALGQADGTRADADGVVVVQHHALHPVHGQVHGGGETGRSATDDNHRVVCRFGSILVGAVYIGVFGIGVTARHVLASYYSCR